MGILKRSQPFIANINMPKSNVKVLVASRPESNRITWREVLAVLLTIPGGILYCVLSKKSATQKLIVLLLSSAVGTALAVSTPPKLFTSTSTQGNQTESKASPVLATSPSPPDTLEQRAQDILNQVTQNYGFSRFIDTWGTGAQGLFLPEKAWNNLSTEEQTTLIDYVQSKGVKAIVVGRQKSKDVISVDRTVWGGVDPRLTRGKRVFEQLNGIYQVAGQMTTTPVVRIVVPQDGWNRLSKEDQVNLTIYAKSLISVVKANPTQYVDIPSTSPLYSSFAIKTSSLCEDCWSIVLSYGNQQPYGIDQTVVSGDTPWTQDDPCCRGIKASEFRNQ